MSMANHQQQQPEHEDQETMVSMDSQKNPNLETTNNHHHHVLPSPLSSSQDFKWTTHHQQDKHISNKTHEDKGFIFKNAYEVIKNPNFLSFSSSAALASAAEEEGYTTPPPPPPRPPQDFKKVYHQNHTHVSKKINENEGGFTIKNPNNLSCSSSAAGEEVAVVEESGRDRLKRHRVEMAGRVRIPDIWGHEDLLKDWIDCTVFDSSLGNNSIMSARAALVQERRSTLRVKNQC